MATFWLWVLRPAAFVLAAMSIAAGALAAATWDLSIAIASMSTIVGMAANRAGASAAQRRARAGAGEPIPLARRPEFGEEERRRAA